MFKFNVKVDNEHKLNTKINNEHTFVTQVKNIHNFVLKSLIATIYLLLGISTQYSLDSKIGGRKTFLEQWREIDLKSLPSSLRQMVGSYVYVKAKARIQSINSSKAVVSLTSIMKMSIRNLSFSRTALTTVVLGKMKFLSKNISTSTLKLVLLIKTRFENNTTKSIVDLVHALKMKTKLNHIYFSTSNSESVYKILAKLKSHTFFNNITSLSVKCLVKIRNVQNKFYSTAKVNRLALRAKIRANSVSSSVSNLGGHMPLILYSQVNLKDLPQSLKKMVGSCVRTVAKMRFTQFSKSVETAVGKAILKMKVDSIVSPISRFEEKVVKCKKLNDYTNFGLKDTPSSLYDFCYSNNTSTWNNVLNTNSNWEEVKTTYKTWEEVLNS